jgi:hypothetical protein
MEDMKVGDKKHSGKKVSIKQGTKEFEGLGTE